MEDDFEIDEQSVAASARGVSEEAASAVETNAVATQSLATGTHGGPTFSSESMQSSQTSARQSVATVIDPNVAESSAAVDVPAPAEPAKRGLSALGGLNLIRKVAGSFGGSSSEAPKKQPFKERRLDGDDDEDGDLQIPAFLRRQAN